MSFFHRQFVKIILKSNKWKMFLCYVILYLLLSNTDQLGHFVELTRNCWLCL